MTSALSNFYEKIRSSVNVSEIVRSSVVLSKKGMEHIGLCPFHSEKTPSFTVNDKKRFYHCFGCGANGDNIKFESEQSGLSYRDAALKIAGKFGIDLPKFSDEESRELETTERVTKLLKQASDFYAQKITPEVISILNKRGIANESIKNYKIGHTGKSGELISYFNSQKIKLDDLELCGLVKKYDGKYIEFFRERIIIPILSNFGKVIGFGARSIGSEMPKYINSPDTIVFKKGDSLFGEDIATGPAYKSGRIIIVEGYFDAIALQSAGFKESVASLGTAVTQNHLKKLWKVASEIVICLDGDDAGIRASKKVIDNAISMLTSECKLSFVLMPKGMDPDDLVNQNGAHGFKKLLDNRMSLAEYVFHYYTYNKSFKSPEEKSSLERELLDLANNIQDTILKKNIYQFFKNKLWDFFRNPKKVHQRKVNMLSIPEKDEITLLDEMILCYLILNFKKIALNKVLSILASISDNTKSLNDIVDLVNDTIANNDNVSAEDLESMLKKTSFSSEFEILFAKYRKNYIPEANTDINADNVIDFFMSKRYLIFLKKELSELSKVLDVSNVDKYNFYLSEIAKTREKIEEFNVKSTSYR